jgi:hypothetical protein
MRALRPVIAIDPRQFGRRPLPWLREPERASRPISDDLRLFATSFAVGFLFVTVLIF